MEIWLAGRGLVALPAALALRTLVGYLLTHTRWVLDTQLIASALVMAALLGCGSLLGRRFGEPLGKALGSLAWVFALSFLPHYLGWKAGSAPPWILYGSFGLFALAFIYRAARIKRWVSVLTGHGFEWILEWAAARPFYARLAAVRVLTTLGYYSSTEE